MSSEGHQQHFKVRDYECDMQGVVNNAVYQNYLEHARHEYLLALGLDFAELTRQGVHLVVVRAELDYRRPLRSGDRFVVESRLARESRLRVAFLQQIRRQPDGELMLDGRIIGAAITPEGRPGRIPAELAEHLE